ncbi:hypothetical protein [Nonomuraea dietziae]|uniref:hypothetical protein n=1 Tax=Nonomuraea dietziae TaxID=65515 RepID=UPI00341AB9CD
MNDSGCEPRLLLVTGLRALADFLESRSEVSAPHQADATVFAPCADDAQMSAEMEQVALLLGSSIDVKDTVYGHRPVVSSGRIRCRALAILAAARTCHNALTSYSGVIVPNALKEVCAMNIPLFIVYLALFLTAGVLLLFAVLIIGIRAEDRRMNMTAPPRTLIETLTRYLLGAHVQRCPENDPELRREEVNL